MPVNLRACGVEEMVDRYLGKLKVIEGRVEKYDVTSNLAHSNAGINFGQLLRGDAKDAEK